MSQPVELYPTNPVIIRQQPHNSPRTDGSFAPVFIALVVIFVLSAVACVVGRFCSKWHHRVAKEPWRQPMASKLLQSNGSLGPKMWEARRNPVMNSMKDHGDIEFGFDKRNNNNNNIPCAKMAINSVNGGGKAKISHQHNQGHRSQVRFAGA